MKRRRKKTLRTSILAFAVAAIASPVAQAGRVYVDGGAGPAPAAKVTPTAVVKLGSRTSSFGWSDAGITAGTAFGATVALLGGVAVARRNRQGQLAV